MKDNILMQIANGLSANVQKLMSPGLLEGKMGVAVFLYHYARSSGRTAYSQLADYLLDEILESINQSQLSFVDGLSGIGWGIKHLLKAKVIDATDDILDELDNTIIRTLTNRTTEDIIDGCIYLIFNRPELLNDSLMQFVAKNFST